MSTQINLIIAETTPKDGPTFKVTDLAVALLWKHGWEPPAAQSYNIADPSSLDGGRIIIPARPAQRTATPSAEQIADTILDRIGARIKLGGGLEGNFVHSYQEGIKDAAEAIQDLYGAQQ